MIVQSSTSPGFTIGVNGLAGNLGIAFAAILTGFLVRSSSGWRLAFAVPSLLAIVCGVTFAIARPARGDRARQGHRGARWTCPPRDGADLPGDDAGRHFSSLIFNFTTNGNDRLLAERPSAGPGGRPGHARRPARGGLHHRVVRPARRRQADRPLPDQVLYLPDRGPQVPLSALAAYAEGWTQLRPSRVLFMVFVFGAIPFIDAMIVQSRGRPDAIAGEPDAARRLPSGSARSRCTCWARWSRPPLHGAAHDDGGHLHPHRALRLAPARRGAGGCGSPRGEHRPRLGHRAAAGPGLARLELGAETEQRRFAAVGGRELHPEGQPGHQPASGTDIAGLPEELNSGVNPMVPSTALVYRSTSSVIMSITPRGCGGRHIVGESRTS